MRSLRENTEGIMDLSLILMIGIAFVALVVVAYVIYQLRDQLLPHAPTASDTGLYNGTYMQVKNLTVGFDNAIALILVAITIFILAIAISALLIIRSR